jgi:uncharacterized RDD family membrane protein YckC
MATWYYVENGQQCGPLTAEAFAERVSQGLVQADTLVWNESLADWQPYAKVRAAAVQRQAEALVTGTAGGALHDGPTPLRATAAAASTGTPAAGVTPAPVAVVGTSAQAPLAPLGAIRCAECGLPFPPDEVIPIAGQWLCAGCKPMALQKLREGVGIAGTMQYAGFWIRFAARMVDWIILSIPSVGVVILVYGGLFAMLATSAGRGEPPTALTFVAMAIMGLILFTVPLCYTVFFLGRYGATPGKMACGLRVVRRDGSAITYARATGRFFADLLNGWTFYIGYLIAAFDVEKRTLHDHICDTRVVYK